MTIIKLSKLIDTFFVCGFCFLVFFCWIRFYTKNTLLSLFCGAFLTASILIITTKLLKRKNEHKKITQTDKINAQFCALQFGFMPLKQCVNYFYDILKKENKVAIFNSHLVLNPNTKNATLFIPLFFKNEVVDTDIQSAFIRAKQQNCKSVIICAKGFNQSAVLLASKLKDIEFDFFGTSKLYNEIIKPHPLPPKIVDTTIEKLSFKQLVFYAFSKKRIKNYIAFGLILLVSSFFVYNKLYYLISGTLLLVLCIVILSLPDKKKTVSKT